MAISTALSWVKCAKFPTEADWVTKNVQEISDTWDTSLITWAQALAMLHPYALDYIKQAPVIVIALKGDGSYSNEYYLTKASYKFRCEPPLRELMGWLNLNLRLRVLLPESLSYNNLEYSGLCRLKTMDHNILDRGIPREPALQRLWVQRVGTWCNNWRWRARATPGVVSPLLEWAVLHLAETTENFSINDLADYAFAVNNQRHADTPFNPEWGLARALRESAIWHRNMTHRNHRIGFEQVHGLKYTDVVDYTPFSNEDCQIGEYTFVPLDTGEKLAEEGLTMHHCVATYAGPVVQGRSRIFSIRKGEERVATVEFQLVTANDGWSKPRWTIAQIKGKYNARVDAELVKLIEDNYGAKE